MRRGGALIAVAVAVVALAFALLLNGLGDPTPASASGGTTAQQADDDAEAEQADRPDEDERGDHGHGHGPPSWAHGGDRADKHAGQKIWAGLTPAQREQRMRTLAEVHARGMKQWHRCITAGRSACEKPLPPGLAKKHQGG